MKDSRRILGRLAVAVMAADGRITRSEMEMVSELRSLGLGDLGPFVRAELEQLGRAPIDPERVAAELEGIDLAAAGMVVAALAEIATADGVLSKNELDVLRTVGRRLGVAETDCDRIAEASAADHGARLEGAPSAGPSRPEATGAGASRPDATGATPAGAPAVSPEQRAARGEPSPREELAGYRQRAARILGVREDASRQDVEAAYRRAIELYDPQRVIDLGPEFAVLAVRRLQAATDAFQLLLASDA